MLDAKISLQEMRKLPPFLLTLRNGTPFADVAVGPASQIVEATPGAHGHALFMFDLVDSRQRFVDSLKRAGAPLCLHLRISPFIITFPLQFIGVSSMP